MNVDTPIPSQSTKIIDHKARRKAILRKYPQVRQLFGPEPLTIYIVTLLVMIQCGLAYAMQHAHWWVWLPFAYLVGGVINHSLTLAIHEISHNLACRRPTANKILSLVANLPLIFPYAISFKRYHHDHHVHLGWYPKDTDVPSPIEKKLFRHPLFKLVWMIFQPLFYALRPLFIYPKKPTRWDVINLATQLAFIATILITMNLHSLIYLMACTLLGLGLHPMSGHYISEHYIYQDTNTQETCSYYGPLNAVTFNVGYHNEHHDFPSIPWTRLKKLRDIAPEFYQPLHAHRSWVKLICRFIFSRRITLNNHFQQ